MNINDLVDLVRQPEKTITQTDVWYDVSYIDDLDDDILVYYKFQTDNSRNGYGPTTVDLIRDHNNKPKANPVAKVKFA